MYAPVLEVEHSQICTSAVSIRPKVEQEAIQCLLLRRERTGKAEALTTEDFRAGGYLKLRYFQNLILQKCMLLTQQAGHAGVCSVVVVEPKYREVRFRKGYKADATSCREKGVKNG